MLSALAEGYNVALTADVPKVARVAGLGIIKLAQRVRPADLSDRDRDQPARRARELGPHRDQPAVRPGRRRCRRAGARAGAMPTRRARSGAPRARGCSRCGDGARLCASPIGRGRAAAVADGPAAHAARLSPADGGRDAACARARLLVGSSAARSCRRGCRAARREHGRASAGPAGVGARRERRRDALGHPADRAHPRQASSACWCTSGTVTSAESRRATSAAGRDPSVRAARHAALRRALPRSLAARSRAVRRIRSMAQPDHGQRGARHSADPGQRPAVRALVRALAARPRDHRRAAAPLRSLPGAIARACRALSRSGRAARHHHRQPQVRRAGAAGRPPRPWRR